MRKIVSFLLIAVFLIVPVSAASSSSTDVEYIQKSSFWTWVAGKGKPLNGIIGNTFGAVCPNSEDGYHHASSYERPIGNWTVESGYYKCICDLCGDEFKAYEKDLQQSYEAQVGELPANGYNSDGSLLWSPKHKFLYLLYAAQFSSQDKYYDCPHASGNLRQQIDCIPTFDCSNLSFSVRPSVGSDYFFISSAQAYFSDVYPIDGYYIRIVRTYPLPAPRCPVF